MDNLWSSYTANVAYAISQLCIAIIMGGLYFLAPTARSTRYWAISGLLSVLASTLTAFSISQFGHFPLIISSTLMIAAMTTKWWGIQAFFGKKPAYAGWYLMLGFFVAYSLVAMMHPAMAARTLLFFFALTLLTFLNVTEVISAKKLRLSFANSLVIIAYTLAAADFLLHGILAITGNIDFAPGNHDPINVFGLYLIPMWCNLLGSLGLLLMYFESIILEKEHLATHDELTKLHNRRALVTCGQREVDMAYRYQRPLSVFMLDLDHFKIVNDTYGHDAGDQVLRDVAQALRNTCRSTDIIGRYGGEEICIICPQTSREEAVALGERLLSAFRNLRHAICDNRNVTCSLGLYIWNPETDLATSWETMLHRVDTALYAAKAAGRDCMLQYNIDNEH